jgi:hypothetical protein
MIQRYILNNIYGIADMDKEHIGDDEDTRYYLCTDIDPLIEWRDFTGDSDLEDGKSYRIWHQEEPEETIAYFGDGEFHHECGSCFTIEDGIKWQPLSPNPWSKS